MCIKTEPHHNSHPLGGWDAGARGIASPQDSELPHRDKLSPCDVVVEHVGWGMTLSTVFRSPAPSSWQGAHRFCMATKVGGGCLAQKDHKRAG